MPQALRPSIEMEQKPPQPNEDTFLVVAAFHLLPIVCYSLTFGEVEFCELRLKVFSKVRLAPVRYPGASDAQGREESDPS
jgi:hypothetical protein